MIFKKSFSVKEFNHIIQLMTTEKQDQLFLCVRTQLYKQIKQDLLSILGMKFPP